MRRFMLLLTGLIALATPALATQMCSNVADQSAYEVLTLREQMMVLVIKCSRDQDYNKNFVVRFQPALQANDRAVMAYFRRLYGNNGRGRMDSFMTELVNTMSQQANKQGGEYCPRAGLIINELNALHSMDELASYAAVKDLAPPGTSMCPETAAKASPPPKRR
jgi:hypothetical protein